MFDGRDPLEEPGPPLLSTGTAWPTQNSKGARCTAGDTDTGSRRVCGSGTASRKSSGCPASPGRVCTGHCIRMRHAAEGGLRPGGRDRTRGKPCRDDRGDYAQPSGNAWRDVLGRPRADARLCRDHRIDSAGESSHSRAGRMAAKIAAESCNRLFSVAGRSWY